MKTVLTAGGIETFISLRENEFLMKMDDTFSKKDLSENEMYMASNLLKRGILKLVKDRDGQLIYAVNANRLFNDG